MVYNVDIPGGNLRWYKDVGILGMPVQAVKIYRFLSGRTIRLFVTGPSLKLVASDPYAVRYAIETLYEDFTFSGGWPPLSDLLGDGEPGTIN